MTGEGPSMGPSASIQAGSRATFNLAEHMPNRDLAVKVLSSAPVMAERRLCTGTTAAADTFRSATWSEGPPPGFLSGRRRFR
jgi:hypothetical protein